MATVAEDDFDSDQEFCWTGDKYGLEYSHSVGSLLRNSNADVAPYLSCNHVSVISSSPTPASVGKLVHPSAAVSRLSSSMACLDSPPSILMALQSLLSRLSDSLISPD